MGASLQGTTSRSNNAFRHSTPLPLAFRSEGAVVLPIGRHEAVPPPDLHEVPAKSSRAALAWSRRTPYNGIARCVGSRLTGDRKIARSARASDATPLSLLDSDPPPPSCRCRLFCVGTGRVPHKTQNADGLRRASSMRRGRPRVLRSSRRAAQRPFLPSAQEPRLPAPQEGLSACPTRHESAWNTSQGKHSRCELRIRLGNRSAQYVL